MRYIYGLLLILLLSTCSNVYLGELKSTVSNAETYGWEFIEYVPTGNYVIFYDAELDWDIYLYSIGDDIYKAIYVMSLDGANDFRFSLLTKGVGYGDIVRCKKHIYYFQYMDESTVIVTVLRK